VVDDSSDRCSLEGLRAASAGHVAVGFSGLVSSVASSLVGSAFRRNVLLLVSASVVAGGCGPYRLPDAPTSSGSVTNLVIYAYFSLDQTRYGFPPSYTQFFVDRDEEVVFILQLEHPGPAFIVQGVLYRPDGSQDRAFQRDVALSPPGYARTFNHRERFPVSGLAAYLGKWNVRLLINGALAGTYWFRLEDSRAGRGR